MFGASPVAEWPLMEGPVPTAGLEGATEGSSSKRVRFSSVRSLVGVADETFAFVEKLVKAANESLIVQAQAPNNGTQAVRNLLGIFRFQVVVDEQDHGNGRGSAAK